MAASGLTSTTISVWTRQPDRLPEQFSHSLCPWGHAQEQWAIKEGLMAFVSSTGLLVVHHLLQAEMTERIGLKHAKLPGREAN